jgi:hypothetical protein
MPKTRFLKTEKKAEFKIYEILREASIHKLLRPDRETVTMKVYCCVCLEGVTKKNTKKSEHHQS